MEKALTESRFVLKRRLALSLTAIAVLTVLLPLSFAAQPALDKPGTPSTDAASIVHLIKSTWEKPDSPLVVEPVVTVGDHGVAGWVQGERGGRALLRRQAGKWKVVACGGDAMKDASVLAQAGMQEKTARELARQIAVAESRIPVEQRQKFSLFGATVHMDSAHGSAH